MNDEQLRQLYARATSARTSTRRTACPTPEALEALARREGSEQQRLETLDHVMACPDCREEFELFRAIEHTRRADTTVNARHVHWRRPMMFTVAAALAAGVALVAVLGPWSSRQGRRGPDVMRSATAGVELAAPAADATVSQRGITFVWRSVPDARRYTLEVLTPAGAVRARRETTDTTAAIPAAELGAGDLRWSVRAQLAGGEVSSLTRRLRVGLP